MGKVFAVIEVKIKDPAAFQRYAEGYVPSLHAFGGRIVAADPDFLTVEGQREADVLVIHEWPLIQAFRAWYASEQYEPWARLCQEQAAHWTRVMLLPQGVPALVAASMTARRPRSAAM